MKRPTGATSQREGVDAAPAPPACFAAAAPLFCGGCRYDLRGIEAGRCPECGRRFDRTHLIASLVPWEQRRFIGRLRAWFQTIRLGTFQPSQIAGKMNAPVSLKEARRFRWGTLLAAYLPMVIGLLVLRQALKNPSIPAVFTPTLQTISQQFQFQPPHIPPLYQIGMVLLIPMPSLILVLIGLFLTLLAVTAVPGWFFVPKRLFISQRNRAYALSHYACAPLGWLPGGMGLIGVVVWLENAAGIYNFTLAAPGWNAGDTLVLAGMGLIVFLMFLYWIDALILMRKTTGSGMSRLLMMGGGVPILWILLSAGIMAGLYLAASFLVLVRLSFR